MTLGSLECTVIGGSDAFLAGGEMQISVGWFMLSAQPNGHVASVPRCPFLSEETKSDAMISSFLLHLVEKEDI